jgi:cephalosporin hydroxylase
MRERVRRAWAALCGKESDPPPLRRAEYDDRYGMSLREWLRFHQGEIVFDKVSWMGKRIWKNILDAWIYQEIIWEVQPEVIVEIGSKYGGSTLFLANMLDLMGLGQVISIEIDRSSYDVDHPRIIELTGASGELPILEKAREICRNKRVMVIQDGDHRKSQVLQDLENYSGVVSVGSYFIIEDGIVDLFHAGDGLGFENEGPLAAVEAFLETNGNFEVDTNRERYLLTYNPKGYLKRVS